jgi:hypothetical protein
LQVGNDGLSSAKGWGRDMRTIGDVFSPFFKKKT